MVPRLYVDMPLAEGETVILPDAPAHHLRDVLRAGEGDALVLFNGQGGEWRATVAPVGVEKAGVTLAATAGAVLGAKLSAKAGAKSAVRDSRKAAAEKRGVQVTVGPHHAIERENRVAITLVQSLAAADKMDWIVQKAVELGVSSIVPLSAERSLMRLSGERAARRVAHWREIVVAACEQCGRNCVPAVLDVQGSVLEAAQAIAARGSASHHLLLDTRDAAPLSALSLPADLSTTHVVLWVGPESGFSDAERDAWKRPWNGHLQGISAALKQPVSLGPRVLRTETAGLAAMSALLTHWGAW
jgi:16S rRNA (uracil1498-N3)-methyltransferase